MQNTLLALAIRSIIPKGLGDLILGVVSCPFNLAYLDITSEKRKPVVYKCLFANYVFFALMWKIRSKVLTNFVEFK